MLRRRWMRRVRRARRRLPAYAAMPLRPCGSLGGGVRQQAADDKQAALDAAAAKHAAELERANAEAQRKIAELTAALQQVERSLERAEKRAEGNSLSRYLLARLRGEEVPDSADDGDSKGGKR